jgi:hypothetical protein
MFATFIKLLRRRASSGSPSSSSYRREVTSSSHNKGFNDRRLTKAWSIDSWCTRPSPEAVDYVLSYDGPPEYIPTVSIWLTFPALFPETNGRNFPEDYLMGSGLYAEQKYNVG